MLTLRLEDDNGRFDFPVNRVINGGYSGRDRAAVMAHVEELEREGIPPPTETPVFFAIPRDRMTLGDSIEVYGDKTSGEVEYVLLLSGGRMWVGVGSDHTDRELERLDIPASKRITPNVMASRVWSYNDIKDHWDQVVIRSWTGRGRKTMYQEAALSLILTPGDLLEHMKRHVTGSLEGAVVYSGTVAALAKEGLGVSDYFEFEMEDPVRNRRIQGAYAIQKIDWFRG
ncbi:MAG: DUF2848 family protein [Bacillota bacterium]